MQFDCKSIPAPIPTPSIAAAAPPPSREFTAQTVTPGRSLSRDARHEALRRLTRPPGHRQRRPLNTTMSSPPPEPSATLPHPLLEDDVHPDSHVPPAFEEDAEDAREPNPHVVLDLSSEELHEDDAHAEPQVDHLHPEKPRRPISYPWGPEANLEVPEYAFTKRYSDPPKPGSLSKGAKVQVKPFTKESLERLERKTVQLVREYGFQPRRKLSVEDGSRLPAKYEPFPSKLYGRPLEEIDNFIYDEVDVGLFFTVVS